MASGKVQDGFWLFPEACRPSGLARTMRLPVEKPVTIGTRVKIGKAALSVPRASIAVHGVLDRRAAAGDGFFPNARRSSGSNAYLGRQ